MLQCKKSRLVLVNSILKIVLMVWIKSTKKKGCVSHLCNTHSEINFNVEGLYLVF